MRNPNHNPIHLGDLLSMSSRDVTIPLLTFQMCTKVGNPR
jgi:hypothetical protein